MHGKTMYGQIQREELGFYHSSFFCRTRCCLAGFEGRDASDSSSSIPLHRSRSALRPTFLFAISQKHVKLGFPRSQRKRREGFSLVEREGGEEKCAKKVAGELINKYVSDVRIPCVRCPDTLYPLRGILRTCGNGR